MSKTNIGLTNYAIKALNENWGYVLGTFGNLLTEALLKQKQTQVGGVGEFNSKHIAYQRQFLGKRVTDCYGLVKACLWDNGSGSVNYNSAQDRNQEMAFNAAKEKGTINTIPEIKGLVLWMKGHAGVYIGNGEFIECVGSPVGMRKGKIQNGKVVSGSKFTHWFKDTYIDYLQADNIPKLVADCIAFGVQLDKPYWDRVLKGEITADQHYVEMLQQRLAEKKR